MEMEDCLAIALAKWKSLENFKQHDNCNDYEKEFSQIWLDWARLVLRNHLVSFRAIKSIRKGLILLFSLISGCMMGQNLMQNEEEFAINFIDVRQGLLSNFVTKTVSDNDNIKYFATEDGVSKFDGYNFTDYRPSNEFKGLENENVETLFKDRNNNIWIGTKAGGLSMLEIRTNKIVSFNRLFSEYTRKKLRVISINQNKEGFI